MVAGTRFARMSTGYEPVEVLLLQPAIPSIIRFLLRKSRFRNIVLCIVGYQPRLVSIAFGVSE